MGTKEDILDEHSFAGMLRKHSAGSKSDHVESGPDGRLLRFFISVANKEAVNTLLLAFIDYSPGSVTMQTVLRLFHTRQSEGQTIWCLETKFCRR